MLKHMAGMASVFEIQYAVVRMVPVLVVDLKFFRSTAIHASLEKVRVSEFSIVHLRLGLPSKR
jgi:hypothetical protein